jgi:hypothetical protein
MTLFCFAFFIIISVGLNNFKNFYFKHGDFQKLNKKPEEFLYKKILFLYLFLMGIIILFFNDVKLYGIPMSCFVGFIHLIYTLLINFIVRPYQNSLKIHKSILFAEHVVYLIFLVMINMINLHSGFNEYILLIFIYVTVGFCKLINILTAVRLYYEYRYGEAL